MTTCINTIATTSVPSSQLLAELKAVEGARVDLTLRDGSQLDDCQLVSTGRLRAKSIWVLWDDVDLFIRLGEVVSVQAASAPTEPWL